MRSVLAEFAVRCLLMSCLGGLRTCRLCPPVLRHTLPEKGLEEVDIQVDIMDCLMLDVTASLGTAGFCITHFHDSSLLLKLLYTNCFFSPACLLVSSEDARMDAVLTAGQITEESAVYTSMKPFQSCKWPLSMHTVSDTMFLCSRHFTKLCKFSVSLGKCI